MSEYTEVEQPFLQQLAAQGWTVIDQGTGVPQAAWLSLRTSFRQWWLPEVFRQSVSAINALPDGTPWLTAVQLDELKQQLLRQPKRTLLEANQVVHDLLMAERQPRMLRSKPSTVKRASLGWPSAWRTTLPGWESNRAGFRSRNWAIVGPVARERAVCSFTGSA